MDFGRVLLQIFMQRIFFWAKCDLTWAALSLCNGFIAIQKYITAGRQGQEAQSWFALEEQRNMLQQEEKIGEAEQCWQPQKKKTGSKEMPKHWAALKTLGVVDGENLSRDRV